MTGRGPPRPPTRRDPCPTNGITRTTGRRSKARVARPNSRGSPPGAISSPRIRSARIAWSLVKASSVKGLFARLRLERPAGRSGTTLPPTARPIPRPRRIAMSTTKRGDPMMEEAPAPTDTRNALIGRQVLQPLALRRRAQGEGPPPGGDRYRVNVLVGRTSPGPDRRQLLPDRRCEGQRPDLLAEARRARLTGRPPGRRWRGVFRGRGWSRIRPARPASWRWSELSGDDVAGTPFARSYGDLADGSHDTPILSVEVPGLGSSPGSGRGPACGVPGPRRGLARRRAASIQAVGEGDEVLRLE